MSEITKKLAPDRSKIAMDDDQDVKYWTRHHLGVSREDCGVLSIRSVILPPAFARN
jgi:hypothetical protein